MLNIRPATAADKIELSVMVVTAFGQRNEWALVEALRKAGDLAIELVAEDQGGLLGHACLSWLQAPDGWMTLSPLSVRPSHQGEGIGGELVRYGVDAARQAKARAVVVVGEPAYYKRLGFVFGGSATLHSPYPEQYTGLYPIAPETAMAQAELVYPEAFQNA